MFSCNFIPSSLLRTFVAWSGSLLLRYDWHWCVTVCTLWTYHYSFHSGLLGQHDRCLDARMRGEWSVRRSTGKGIVLWSLWPTTTSHCCRWLLLLLLVAGCDELLPIWVVTSSTLKNLYSFAPKLLWSFPQTRAAAFMLGSSNSFTQVPTMCC